MEGKLLWLCAVLPAILAAGCTVLEDRLPCPCYLDVDYREVLAPPDPENRCSVVEVNVLASEPVWTVRHPLEECPSVEEVSVEKAQVQLVAVVHDRPLQDFLDAGTAILYEPGNQIDSLYVHTGKVDCTAEEAVCVLHPHKQFSTLFFTDESGGDLCRQYNLVIRGSTCGFDAADLSAVDGEYLYTVQENDGTGRISVRVPRQKRNDLMLEFWDKESFRKWFACPVGLYLFAAGYDPLAEDLPDFELRIDFRAALVYLRVAGWSEETIYSLYD